LASGKLILARLILPPEDHPSNVVPLVANVQRGQCSHFADPPFAALDILPLGMLPTRSLRRLTR
jgi:hypothetical protein